MDARRRIGHLLGKVDLADPALWVLLVTAIFVSVTAAAFARLYYYNVVDDAYISFQYTRNLVEGRGLVFNPGEYVEGYTNFLWVIVLAPVYAVTRALELDFTRAAIGVSIVIAMCNLGLVYAIGRKLFDRDWFAISIALVLCALDNAYLGYAMSALENPLLMFCSLVAVFAWVRPAKHAWAWTGGALAAACMTRPDAGLLMAAFGLSALMALVMGDPWRPWETRRSLAKHAALALVVWLVAFGAYFAWRLHYYGELLPNTFHLKVGSRIDATERGIVYVTSFFEDRYYVPVLAVLAVFWPRHMVIRWLLLWVIVHGAYVTYVGGDFYSGHRFLVVLLPVLALLVGWVVHRVNRRLQRFRFAGWLRSRTLAMALLLGVINGLLAFGLFHFGSRGFDRGPYTHEITLFRDGVHNNILFTRWLGTFTKRGESIVVGDIGSTGFFTDLIVHDVYGVIDPVVARMEVRDFGRGKAGHEKRASRDYLMKKEPTYVKWGYVPGDLRPFGYWVFTDFPPGFKQAGLWVRENLGSGYYLQEPAIRFHASDLEGWRKTGNAFSQAPTTRPVTGQAPPFGYQGPYLNSFVEGLGDRATGTLVSTPIPLKGDLMVLLVGGGRDEDRLRVSLLVDGKRVASATGHDQEVLGRRVWDIASFKGKTGRIEVVDDSMDGWGHIMVDDILQWVRTSE
jgi:hypothetical protein